MKLQFMINPAEWGIAVKHTTATILNLFCEVDVNYNRLVLFCIGLIHVRDNLFKMGDGVIVFFFQFVQITECFDGFRSRYLPDRVPIAMNDG